jgi:hypothetical protein
VSWEQLEKFEQHTLSRQAGYRTMQQLHILCPCRACMRAAYDKARAPIVLATPSGKQVWKNLADGLTFEQFEFRCVQRLGSLDNLPLEYKGYATKPRGYTRYTEISQESYTARIRVRLLKDGDSEH